MLGMKRKCLEILAMFSCVMEFYVAPTYRTDRAFRNDYSSNQRYIVLFMSIIDFLAEHMNTYM